MIQLAFQKDRPLFIPFIMAGYPQINMTTEAIFALVQSGADIIEVGLPFSDPLADGPVNQRAADIALQNGMTLTRCLEIISTVRRQGCAIPMVLFSYLNPLLAFGISAFAAKAKAVGINALLVVDLPPEEGQEYYALLQSSGVAIILLASPTTEPRRFALYKQLNPAFVYYIARLGTTGMQAQLTTSLEKEVQALRLHLPQHKIVVGFGISNAEQARSVAQFADGVVIGSALVQELEQKGLSGFQVRAQQLSYAIHEARQ
jgi:tryptophan synthase alpha chain